MKIVLIILSMIGLLKLVSLFIMLIIEIYQKIKNKGYIEIHKEYGIFYKDVDFYIIPSISFTMSSIYFEVMFNFLKWQYYAAYKLEYEEK